MTDGPDNLMLVYLRRTDARVEKLLEDMREVKQHLGHLEEQYASLSRRSDSIDLRLERVERRLDLSEPAHS